MSRFLSNYFASSCYQSTVTTGCVDVYAQPCGVSVYVLAVFTRMDTALLLSSWLSLSKLSTSAMSGFLIHVFACVYYMCFVTK